MNFSSSNTGENIGYIDYSTSGISASIFQSSADLESLLSLNRLTLIPLNILQTIMPLNQPFDWQPGIQKILTKYDEALRELANI